MQTRGSLANEAARLLKVEALPAHGNAARVAQLAVAAAGLLDGRTSVLGGAAASGVPVSGERHEIPTGASKLPASEIPQGSDVQTKVSWLRRLFGGQR